ADTGNRRVQVFDLDGNLIRAFAVAGWEYNHSEPYLALDKAGRLWLSDSMNNRVQADSQTGRLLGTLGRPGQLTHAIGIAVDKDDVLYIADTMNHRLLEVPLSSEIVGAP